MVNWLVNTETGEIVEYTDEVDLIIVEVMQIVGSFKGEFIFDINIGLDYTFFELSPAIMDYQMIQITSLYNRFFEKPIEWNFTLIKELNIIAVMIDLIFYVRESTIKKQLKLQVYKGV